MTELLEFNDTVVVELLDRAAKHRGSASALMRDVFAKHDLRPRQQKKIKDRFFRVLSSEALLDYAVERATPAGRLVPALRDPVRVLMVRLWAGDLSAGEATRRLAWIDWQQVARAPQDARQLDDPVARLQLVGSLPAWLARRFADEFGDAALAVVEGLVGPAPVTLRANTLRTTREQLAARLLADGISTQPTEHATAGLRVTSPAQLFRHPTFRDGWFEMQDEASQLVAELVAPPPGGVVLDACAGAGGKSLALAAQMNNKGTLVAADSDTRRLRDLQKRARRAGVHNLRAVATPANAWNDEVTGVAARADRVLLDVPCSGLGALRRNPDMRWRATPDEQDRLAQIQLDLACRAAAVLKPGARLVYATCTVLRGENQAVMAAVQARFPQLQQVSVVEILGGDRGRPIARDGYLQTFPHEHGTDGFFAAVLRHQPA